MRGSHIFARRMAGIGLACFGLFATQTMATTHFVRTGTSGNGSSWGNAWGDLSSISWSGLSAGDVVCIAGGRYAGSLTTGASGASGNSIIVKRAVASDANCGSTTAGWNSAFDGQVVMTGTITLRSNYVTIDGVVPNGISIVMKNPSGRDYVGVGVSGPTNGVTLRYVEISGPCLSNFSSCTQNGDHRSISLNHWNGSSYDLQNNMTMQYLNLHGACTLLWSARSINGIIEHSRFADNSTNGTAACHPNVIAEQDSTNMTFRYNEITNWQVEGIMACPSGGCSSSWQIYGNLWHDPMKGSYPRILEAQGNNNGPYLFYNNTIVNSYYECAGTANGGSFASGTKSRNNIFWNSGGSCGLPDEDYNYSDQAVSGQAHGQGYASNPFVNLAAHDYHLAFHVPGLALTAPYNIDFDGNQRASDGVWDRGAYQYFAQKTDSPLRKPSSPTASKLADRSPSGLTKHLTPPKR